MRGFRQLLELCIRNNFEFVDFEDKKGNPVIHIFCSKIPDSNVKGEINKVLPEGYLVEYLEGPKPSSRNHIKALVARMGAVKAIFYNGKSRDLNLLIEGPPDLNLDSPEWGKIIDVLMRDGYWLSWKIFFNNLDISYKLFSAIKGKFQLEKDDKPERDVIIQKNEIIDLKINLETQTCDEFLKSLGVDV